MADQVCGMMLTSKRRPSTSLTVRETPSTATLPFSAMKRARSRGTREVRARCEPFSGDRGDGAEAVDVAGDDVAAELVADPERSARG